MIKNTNNNDHQNIVQNTKDCATQTQLKKQAIHSCALEQKHS